MAIAGFLNLVAPLQPLQILFLNIVTDVFPALALGMNEESFFVMKYKPRRTGEPNINSNSWLSIIVYSIVITVCVLSVFVYAHYWRQYTSEVCNNIAFFSLAFAQLLHPFNVTSIKEFFLIMELYAMFICGRRSFFA